MKRAITRATSLPAIVPTALSETQIWANVAQYLLDARGAFAANTERAIKADMKVFTDWCSQENRQSMPADRETAAAFVDAQAAAKKPATVRRYLSSIATYHRAAEVPNPCEAQKVRLALKRMHNEKGRVQQQADPLNEQPIR